MWFPGPLPLPAELPAAVATGDAFDAIRVCERHGEIAYTHLAEFGRPPGAIVGDRHLWWFLIPPGHHREPWPHLARYLGPGNWLTIPNRKQVWPRGEPGPGTLRWVQRTTPDGLRELTDPVMLRTVLDDISKHLPLAAKETR